MASKTLLKAVDDYERYISEKGLDEKVIDAYHQACICAYQTEKDWQYGLIISERLKGLINEFILKVTGGSFGKLEEWAQEQKKANQVKLLVWYYDLLRMEGRYNVDSFKLYIEKDRKRSARFYEPRRKTLVKISNAIQRLENDELDILFIHMPPRCGKSGDLTMDTVWHCARDMESSNLYITYKEGLGGAFLDGVKEILEDDVTYRFKDIFPDCKIVDTDAKNNKLDLGRKKKYKSLAGKGLESGLNGEYDAYGWMVVDDPLEGIQDVLSLDTLKRKQTIFDNNVLSRKKEKCKMILMGTLWSVNDIYGNYLTYLESNDTGLRYEIIRIPALDPVTEESNFDYDFGVGYTTKAFENIRAKLEMNNDMAGWMAQYQQMPIERDGSVFIPEQMQYYKTLPEGEPIKVIAFCDVALGGLDFLSFPVAYYYEEDGEMIGYIEDVVFDSSEKHITQPQVVAMIKKHKIKNIRFESNQGGEGYKDDVQRLIKEDKAYRTPCNITSEWANNQKTKAQRIWDCAEDIRKLRFKDPIIQHKQYRAFMTNLFSFSMMVRSWRKHDDAPDSLAGLVEFEKNGSGVTKAKIMKVI